MFALGMFTRRANWRGALIGTAAGTLVTVWMAYAIKSSVFALCSVSRDLQLHRSWLRRPVCFPQNHKPNRSRDSLSMT